MLVPYRQREGHSISQSCQFRVLTIELASEHEATPDGPGDQADEYHLAKLAAQSWDPVGKTLPAHCVSLPLVLVVYHDLNSNT